MLSILIPIFNFDVRSFIKELHHSAEKAGILYEIILIDDASEADYKKLNSELQSLSNTEYIQLSINIGRSKIRNLLAEKAKYDYLLFADCDSATNDENIIKKYTDQCSGEIVICGGRNYNKKRPTCKKEYLRWLYGRKRESNNADVRNNYSNRSFMTNNYIISKTIHNAVKFDERLVEYGHEDTLFGIELKRRGVKIKHIENPLIHIGLEKSIDFITKTKKGIDNLNYLINNYNYPELYEEIKLLRIYKKTMNFSFFFRFYFKILRKLTEINLSGKFPVLKLFDLYKLSYLHKITKEYSQNN